MCIRDSIYSDVLTNYKYLLNKVVDNFFIVIFAHAPASAPVAQATGTGPNKRRKGKWRMETASQNSRSSVQLANTSRKTEPMPKGSLAMEKDIKIPTSTMIPK